MKFKLLILLVISLLIILNGCYNKDSIKCDFEEYKKSIGMDEIDMWTCEMEVSGVFYDKEKNKCLEEIKLESIKNACKNPYPFTTIEECEELCKKDISEEDTCIKTGGTWRSFKNGCGDYCGAGDICTSEVIRSCDCPDGCWTGSRCISSRKPCNELTEQGCIKLEYCEPKYVACEIEDLQECTVDPNNSSNWNCTTIENPCPTVFHKCVEKK